MVRETQLFDPSERFTIERPLIDDLALPVGDHYGNEVFDNYLNFYAGIAKRYKPKRILEIGVRYGYTAICMMTGLHANRGAPKCDYLGLDDESYHPCLARANENFAAVVPWATARAIHWNTFLHGVPPDCGMFQLAHVDGNHSYEGVARDLAAVWPVVEVGGLIVLDDAMAVHSNPIWQAIQDFLHRFDATSNMVEYQYLETLRGHYLIRKVD
jgi:predicted O-methyltransferase YrrM